MVFEELIERREERARSVGIDPDIEVEIVLDEIDVAVTKHGEELARDFQFVGVNDAIANRERRGRFVGDAVADAG